MNNLISLNNAFLTNKDILTDIREFEPKANHSPNFLKVMKWLKDSVQLLQCCHIDEVETQFLMKLSMYILVVKARITKESCMLTEMKKIKRD